MVPSPTSSMISTLVGLVGELLERVVAGDLLADEALALAGSSTIRASMRSRSSGVKGRATSKS
jgi:hypothetical protein